MPIDLAFDGHEMIYLDNAATAFPKPREVLERACDTYARYGVNPGRSGYDICVAAGDLVEETRRELCAFFGGTDPHRLTFASNATDALNLAIQGVLRPGDHAVTTMVEHNSVIRPLNHLRRDGGVEVDYVPLDSEFRLDPDEIAKRFRPNTRLVAVNHGSNVIGTVQPVAEVGKRCRARGITFLVDTAQTAGVIPVDMGAMSIDIVAFTGHKSLMAPTGTGGVCVAEHVDIRSTRFGGTGVASAVPFHLEDFPHRLEAGTGNFFGIAGLHFAQAWLRERGIASIHAHEMALLRRLQEGLAGIEGVTLHGTTRLVDRLPVLSFNVVGMEAADVGTMLDVDYYIAARTGLQCAPLIHQQMGTGEFGTVRLSVGAFNTEEHVDKAVAAVRDIAGDAVQRAAKRRKG